MEVFQGFVFQTAAICAVIGYLLGNFSNSHRGEPTHS